MKISNTVKTTSSLILLVVLLSCVSKKSATTEEKQIKTEAKLLFLNFEIVKLDDEKSISLINQITTDGKLKAKNKVEDVSNVGDLECFVLDENSDQIEKYHILNPLKKTVEFINDSGQFEKKSLHLDSAQFSLRLQLKPTAKYFVINEVTETKLIKHLSFKIE